MTCELSIDYTRTKVEDQVLEGQVCVMLELYQY
jgi:hypothetical protein